MKQLVPLLVSFAFTSTPLPQERSPDTTPDTPPADGTVDEPADIGDEDMPEANDEMAEQDLEADDGEVTAEAAAAAAAASSNDKPIGEMVALGVVSAGSLAGGIAYLVAAGNTRDELDRFEGDTLFDRNERRRLSDEESAQSILGYTLVGIGVAAAGGLTYLLLTQRGDDDEDSAAARDGVTVAPWLSPQVRGIAVNARF